MVHSHCSKLRLCNRVQALSQPYTVLRSPLQQTFMHLRYAYLTMLSPWTVPFVEYSKACWTCIILMASEKFSLFHRSCGNLQNRTLIKIQPELSFWIFPMRLSPAARVFELYCPTLGRISGVGKPSVLCVLNTWNFKERLHSQNKGRIHSGNCSFF